MWNNCDAALLAFAQNLCPAEEYVRKGKSALQNVLEVLKTDRAYKVARSCPSGSIAKKTALEGSDFDCVLMINGVHPNKGNGYKIVLDHFWNLLHLHQKKLEISNFRTTRFSLQFQINEEFDVDLLIARNLVEDSEGRTGSEVVLLQRKGTLELIAKSPSDYYLYSSCLAESQIEFMRRQSAFTHNVVKLCKFWLKSLKLGSYVSGVKSAIEMVAVYSAQQHENNGILKAFRSVLIRILGIRTLKICFDPNTGRGIRKINRKSNRPRSQIYDIGIPGNILHKVGFILDPANSFNDLTQDIYRKDGLLEKLVSLTRKTKNLFDSTTLAQIDEPDFESIFQNLKI